MEWPMMRLPTGTFFNYVDKILGFFWPPTLYFDIFYLIGIVKKSNFFDYLPMYHLLST